MENYCWAVTLNEIRWRPEDQPHMEVITWVLLYLGYSSPMDYRTHFPLVEYSLAKLASCLMQVTEKKSFEGLFVQQTLESLESFDPEINREFLLSLFVFTENGETLFRASTTHSLQL